MQNILDISCGLDVHKKTIEACILINNGLNASPTILRESFTTLRGDLIKLRSWLSENGCSNVAMESTGVYWKPVYEILEELPNANICLVNACHIKNIPGRKTDVKDAEWIAELYMCGLLRKSFVPSKEIRNLREYTRLHLKYVQERTRLINRIEKFLQLHGFKLSSVLSKIMCVSGKKILEKLSIKGYVNITDVETLIDRRVAKTPEEIAYAINGTLNEKSRHLLKIMLDTLKSQDERIKIVFDGILGILEEFKEEIDLLDSVPGIDILSASYILAEIGNDMTAFKTDQHLTSWAGLVPRNDESAGVIQSNKILKGNSYVKSILCQCAWAAVKQKNTRLSNWFWRNVKRLGEKKAIIAVARKILTYIWHILSTKTMYNKALDVLDTERYQELKLKAAKKQISILEKNKKTVEELENNELNNDENVTSVTKPAKKTKKVDKTVKNETIAKEEKVRKKSVKTTKKSIDITVDNGFDDKKEALTKPEKRSKKSKNITDSIKNDVSCENKRTDT